MRREERLISRLKAYNETDMYPFHMPGHKRLAGAEDGETGELEFPNPFTVDIRAVSYTHLDVYKRQGRMSGAVS